MQRWLKFLSARSTAENFSDLLAGGRRDDAANAADCARRKQKKLHRTCTFSLNPSRRRENSTAANLWLGRYVTRRRLLPASAAIPFDRRKRDKVGSDRGKSCLLRSFLIDCCCGSNRTGVAIALTIGRPHVLIHVSVCQVVGPCVARSVTPQAGRSIGET